MKPNKNFIILYSLLALAILCCAFLLILILKKPSTENNSAKENRPIRIPENPIISPAIYKDSLKQIYSSLVANYKTSIDTTAITEPAVKAYVEGRITELYKLQNEINELLQSNASIADLHQAKKKIDELQLLVDELRQRTINTENENARLYALLKSYIAKQPTATSNASSSTSTKANTISNEKSIAVGDIKVVSQNEQLQETANADEAERFLVSFEVKNANSNNANADIYVVVVKPDGQVLKNSEWEMGAFETVNGRKIYTYKSKVEVEKGESKSVQFLLNNNNYKDGTYQFQFYYQGKLVARTSKTLS